MKHISLLLLFFTVATFGQSLKWNFDEHTELAYDWNTLTDKNDPKAGYVKNKLDGLRMDEKKKFVFRADAEQRKKFEELFNTQYPEFKNAYEKYAENEGTAAKLELIKVLIKHEEEFRALLTEEQKLSYLTYDAYKGWEINTFFNCYFMTEQQLAWFKKELL